jgi:hypothetical protein
MTARRQTLHGNRMRGLAILLAALWMADCIADDPRVDDRVAAFAALPDWSGIWVADDGVMTEIGLSGRPPGGYEGWGKMILAASPPYKAEWAAEAFKELLPPFETCFHPFPLTMESPWPMQVLITPEETLIVTAGGEIRHVYTDGRDHPAKEDLWPTLWGDSIGHWSGDALEIDTIAVLPNRLVPRLSEMARFTERLRKVGDALENTMTIDDPVALERTWQVKLRYKRVTYIDRMVHADCTENDRNAIVDGREVVLVP